MPLTPKEHEFRYNMVKGRVAETLVQELFLSMGYNVFHYGMERSVPGITNLLKGVKGPVAHEIRSMPDFIVQDNTTGKVFFIEVKFRASGEFSAQNIPEGYPWVNTLFIIVSRRHIKCVSYRQLMRGAAISPECVHFLSERKEFSTDRDTIVSFCHMAERFFEGV